MQHGYTRQDETHVTRFELTGPCDGCEGQTSINSTLYLLPVGTKLRGDVLYQSRPPEAYYGGCDACNLDVFKEE